MARGAPFPRNIADFEADERVSYSTVDQKYLLVDDDGEEWEFNEATGKWFQPVTDEQIAAYQSAYGGGGNDNYEAEAEAPKAQKKRKAPAAADPEPKKPRVQENRGIYITNLPLDTTVDEIDAEFSKYGLIDLSHDGSKRIKMYTDDEGNFKGEALVVYYKKDSVGMAINMMDDSWFRPGQGPNIRVQEADMSYKKTQDSEETKKTLTREQRKAQGANRAELSRKLADWSDDEDEVAKETFIPKNQWAKIAIVKHAFTLKELEEDKDARADIQADMRDEGEKHGKVTNVVIYDLEPEGIVTIRFEDADSAESFIKACNGRSFDGRKLIVTAAQSNPKGKFKKSARYLNEEEEEELLNDLVNGE